MAPAEGPDALNLYWDHFFKAETGTYEKSTWLNLFLAEFLIRLKDGANAKDLINFCPVSGVVTLVGCELLCGIHRVTSSINTQFNADLASVDDARTGSETHVQSDDDRAPPVPFSRATSPAEYLRKYLSGGVVWKCLVLLKALGVEGLSCCRQLSSVLIWLFGEVDGASAGGGALSPFVASRAPDTPIHQLFSNRIWIKPKVCSQGVKAAPVASPAKGSTVSKSKTSSGTRMESENKTRRKNRKKVNSSDSGDSNDDLEVINRSMTINLVTHGDDFDYFNSPPTGRTLKERKEETLYGHPYYTPRNTKPKAEDFTNERHREMMESEISTFEFALLIVDLLRELCKTESSLSGTEGAQISMQCINFSLRNLCSLQFRSLPTCSRRGSVGEVAKLKVALTELLMVSLDKVLLSSDLCAKLINNGTLPMLLRILEDVVCKRNHKHHAKVDEHNISKDEVASEDDAVDMLEFVFGIAYSIAAFFHCLLMQCRSVDKLRQFTDQFKLFGECLKGGLFEECIELMIRIPGVDRDEAVTLIRKLIEAIGKLICGTKRVRSEVIHSAACPRSRHKACRRRVAAGMHHHHDILGEASADLPLSSTCCVSVLYGTLASLVADDEISGQASVRSLILRVMLQSGVCCCFSPSFLMERLVRTMLTHSAAASLCLQVLEQTVYGELGTSVLAPKITDRLPCSVCEPRETAREGRTYCSHGLPSPERKGAWSFLIHYNSLLQLDNHPSVLHATIGHLLRVTPKCRTEMKYEILFSVIYPTFIVSKHRYAMRSEEPAFFLTASCLNVFASLLNTVPFAEQFIQKGGLSYVLELLSMTEFSKQCCSILEIAIAVDIFKLMKSDREITDFREISSLASVQMLMKSLSVMTDKCYKIYELKLPEDVFDELCDVRKERDALSIEAPRRGSEPVPVKKVFCRETVAEETVEDYLEALKNIYTFWKSCANLCLYSPTFREYIARESLFVDSFALLKVLLHYLYTCQCSAPEMRVLIKLVEALVTVHYSVADSSGGKSREASDGVLRAALLAPWGEAACDAVRATCDTLVRVATVTPSPRHVMPRIPHYKIVQLETVGSTIAAGSADGSVDSSSSAESVSGPYESEHSDALATQPDDGYEGDVEVTQAERESVHKSADKSADCQGSSDEESYRGAGGDLAHPDLCLVVVDVLAHIVYKAVESEAPALCALARACCARLASALAQAQTAPPRLLLRLLAPGVAALLSERCVGLVDVQRAVLDLIYAMAAKSIEPCELAAFLRFLNAPQPPFAPLLAALRRLADESPRNTPDFCFIFPVDRNDTEGLAAGEESQGAHAHAEAVGRRLHDGHSREGVTSPWSVGAVRAGLGGWSPWLRGCALAAWVRTSPPAGLLHVLSLGHESLSFELWLDAAAGSLCVRLSRPEAAANRVLAERRVVAALTPHRWAHLALNLLERIHKRRTHIQITIFVDGCELETVSLPVQGIVVRKPMPTCVIVGHAERAQGNARCGFHLSAVQVYRTPVFSAHSALHLAAHGPDFACQVRCLSPNFPSVLTWNLMQSDIDWDQVFELSSATLRELHSSLLLTFGAHAPSVLNLYRAIPTSTSTVTTAAPEMLPARWTGTASLGRHRGLAPALYLLGGPDLLLFLFAKTVEAESGGAEQALALSVLLRVCAADGRLYAALHDGRLDMLHAVLAAPHCRRDVRLLAVLLNAACSVSPVSVEGDVAVIDGRTDAALVDPQLLVFAVKAWRQLEAAPAVNWEVEGGECGRGSGWALALRCARVLLRDCHPLRTFNYYQLTRLELLRHVLLACKERYLSSECGPLDAATSCSLVELVRGLMGSPPPLCHVAMLSDFLLLMHQASDTFVTHSRPNFHFLLEPEARDADKLLKGIVNEQIKDNRIQNASSASENSDSTVEEGVLRVDEGVLRAEEDALTGYVVVEVEDAQHTTVELLSSGMLEQRRVRAGATPEWEACEGLLLVLRDAAAQAQDAERALHADVLLVLANHRSARVRAAVVRCAAALLRRAPPKRQDYYTHLAHQVALYAPSLELAEACAALLTKCDVPLEDQLHAEIWMELSETKGEWVPRSAPLLALLTGSVHDPTLAHRIAPLVLRIIEEASPKRLAEVAVCEVIVRSLRALAAAPEETLEGRDLLQRDLHELLASIAAKALGSPAATQMVADLHLMLSHLERSGEERSRRVARDAQTALFCAQLEQIEERLHAGLAPAAPFALRLLSPPAGDGLSRAELSSRHLAILTRAVRFLTSQSPQLPLHSEAHLAERLFSTLLIGVGGDGSGAGTRRWWSPGGAAGSAEWAALLQEMFWWAFSPARGVRSLQPRLLRALYGAPPTAVHALAPPEPPALRKLAAYLLLVLKHVHAEAEEGPPVVELAITDWAREWAVATQAGLAERLHSETLTEEAARMLRADEERRSACATSGRLRVAASRTLTAREATAARITDAAMSITRQVVEVQNGERKAFMEQVRRAQAATAERARRWRRLVDALAHERAPWPHAPADARLWALDATEAPGRVRVRLRRTHLRIPNKFLKPERRSATDEEPAPAPLRSVVNAEAARGGLAARLRLHETVAYMARVTYVTVAADSPGELLLTDRCIHFVPEEGDAGSVGWECCGDAASWPLEAVRCVATRRWCLQERAAELFLSSGHAHLIAFADNAERSAFLKALAVCHLPNATEPEPLQEATNRWRSGAITNWEYLMKLNGLGGRTYNDLMQYPVLPFVLADYTSRILDLHDSASFRDLSRPMAIQNKSREQHYVNTYNDLKAARRSGCSPLVERQPHHYASLYSNSGGVLHYLVRVPPFTQLFLSYQDDNFDMPDRTFHSLATTWRLITNDSPTDVKEMIPELFYLPEAFCNEWGLALGVRQCGAAVDDVELPPWAADARLFTLIHRQALEARAVTERLPLWVDLVFGYKQTGQAAVDAINVFPACTYYGFDPASLEDEVDRAAAAAMVRTYGQAPRQLLRAPHPHAAPDLAHRPPEPASAWAGLVGVRWGRYCGSPELGAPVVRAVRVLSDAHSLHALAHPRSVAAAPRRTTPLALGRDALALLEWGCADNVVRLVSRNAAPRLLLHLSALDQVTCASTSCTQVECRAVLGLASGRVLALRVRGGALRVRTLYAHSAPLAHVHVSPRAHLLVTASTDGLIVLWDLNDLSYVRTMPNPESLRVTHVTVSETLCDVASVHETPDAWVLRVHTANAAHVGAVRVREAVQCVCYSNAPEGVSVNALAAGMRAGGVRLYSSWDLRPLTHIPAPALGPCASQLTSLAFSCDSQLLFACYSDGTVVAWEAGDGASSAEGSAGGAPVRIHAAHALL